MNTPLPQWSWRRLAEDVHTAALTRHIGNNRLVEMALAVGQLYPLAYSET